MKNLELLINSLVDKVKSTYESSVTLDEAEKLAAEFLYGQMVISEQLKIVDLDARMRKSGYKAICAAIYMENATKSDKKPSDTLLQHLVEQNELVRGERNGLDEIEVERDRLQNYFNIFKDAHIYYRGISRGKFE